MNASLFRRFFVKLVSLLLVVALVSLGPVPSAAQAPDPPKEPVSMPGPMVVIVAAPHSQDVYVPPPSSGMRLGPQAPSASTFNVTYNGFSPEAQAAFQYATSIWAGLLDSPVTINITATWRPLGAGVLGSAGTNYIRRDFAGAPAGSSWFPDTLADRRACVDLGSGGYDIIANFNSTFPSWYLGTDGNPPAGQWDFVTVVLHEIGHGLGFFGSMTVDDGNPMNGSECPGPAGRGCWGYGTGYPTIYDRFTEDPSATSLLNTAVYPNPSVELGNRLTGGLNSVFWNGIYGIAGNVGIKPVMYITTTWQQGSSYSHFDQATYPVELMKPALPSQTAIHNPGARTLGILRDIGWGDELVIEAFGYNTTGPRPEWVQIRNISSLTITLSDYAIGDEERQGSTEGMFVLPNVNLAPGDLFLMRVRNDGAWTYTSRPNPTFCWNCGGGGYTDLTAYTLWSSGSGDLANTGDEVVLLRTNGGLTDPDGALDDFIIDAVCYGSGQAFIDTNGDGAQNGRDKTIFTDGMCLTNLASGSYQRASGIDTCVPSTAHTNNPTAISLESFDTAQAVAADKAPGSLGWLIPVVLMALLGAALAHRRRTIQ